MARTITARIIQTTTITEAQDYETRWLWTYKNERPNMATSGLTTAMELENSGLTFRVKFAKMG